MRRLAVFGLAAAVVTACRADGGPRPAARSAALMSGEIALDAPTTGVADGPQTARDVSFDGTNWYAIWSDLRTGVAQLRGSRLGPTGVPLDGQGTVLVTTTLSSPTPGQVAFDGSHHLVVYRDGGNVYLRPVGLDGVPGPVELIGAGDAVAVASNGDGAMIAFASAGNVITRTRSKTGALGAAQSVGFGMLPRLAWDGANYALAWLLSTNVLGVHLDAAGAAVEASPATILGLPGAAGIDLACDAGVCLAGARASGELRLARWASDGTVSPGPTRAGFGFSPVAIAWDGAAFHVLHTSAFLAGEHLRVDKTGAVLDAGTFETTTEAIACASQCLALLTAGDEVAAVRISGATALDVPPRNVAVGTNAERSPAVAFDGTRYLVVWSDSRGDGADLYGARVDVAGKVIDSPAFAISTAPGPQFDPAVTFDGTSFVVVWRDGRSSLATQHLYAARVSSAGAVLDPAGVPLVTGATTTVGPPAIAGRGGQSVVAYPYGAGGTPPRVLGLRLDDKLVPLGASPLALSTGDDEERPSVATNGTNWLVAWGRGAVTTHLYANTVSATGALGVERLISSSTGSQKVVSVAGRGAAYLAAWLEGSPADVRYTRLGTDGAVLDVAGGVALNSTPTVPDQSPTVVDDGAGFFVAWHESTLPTALGTPWHGAFITDSGGRPAPALLTETLEGSVSQLTLASARDGSRLAVGEKVDRVLYAKRAVARLHTGRENGRACSSAGACLSGFCVDGTCCESACTDQCAACNVAGSLGKCVAASGAPRGSRAACSATGAGTACEARCDGVDTTRCTFAAATVSCGSASCAAGTETHPATCDGAGKCADTPKSCGAYACGASACKTSCTAKVDCAAGHYCKDGACTVIEGLGTTCTSASSCASGGCVDGVCCESTACPAGSACNTSGALGVCKKLAGTSCGGGTECASSFCVDGVCCDRACGGQCEACDLPGAAGKCAAVSGAPRGARPACDDGGGDACKARKCDGASDPTRCAGFANGPEKLCKAAACSDASFSPPSFCDGAGSCTVAKPTSCVPFACSTAGCLDGCKSGDDCAPGYSCVGGTCAAGARCVDDGTSSLGVDGAKTPCAPFRCGSDGKCASSCATSSDCAPGNACNPTDGRCQPSTPPPESGDSGGCQTGHGPASSTSGALLLVLAACLLARRR